MSQPDSPRAPETTPVPEPTVQPTEPTTRDDDASRPRRSAIAHTLYVLGKRRHFIVDARSQLRASVMTTVVVLSLLLVVNLALHSSRERSAEIVTRDSPALTDLIDSQNRVEAVLVALASIVFLGGVFMVSILETHKTAGAAFNVARHMGAIEGGRWSTRLRLRKDDNLRQLEPAFNDMCRALQEHACREGETLERLAAATREIASPPDAERIAVELERMAELKKLQAS